MAFFVDFGNCATYNGLYITNGDLAGLIPNIESLCALEEVEKVKTLILYYSYSGNTKALATKRAAKLGTDAEEIAEVKKPFILVGIYRAWKRKRTAIQPIKSQLDSYDKIIIMSPVWGSYPVSAINSVIEQLPTGKKIELIMVSAGGGTKASAEGTKALVTKRGCEVVGYTDIVARRKGGEVAGREM